MQTVIVDVIVAEGGEVSGERHMRDSIDGGGG